MSEATMKPGSFQTITGGYLGLPILRERTGYLTEVQGIPVGVDRRTREDDDEPTGWLVTELSTGRLIVPWAHDSRRQALHAASKMFDQVGGIEKVREAIERRTPKVADLLARRQEGTTTPERESAPSNPPAPVPHREEGER